MRKWLDDILTYSTHNKGKEVVDERFIKTLESKIYNKMQLIIKNLILVN